MLSTALSSTFSAVVFFVLGCATGLVCCYCFLRYKKSQGLDVAVPPQIPAYEIPTVPPCDKEVNIKFEQNVCYESTLY